MASDIYARLIRDHREFQALLEEISGIGEDDPDARTRLLARLKIEVTTHTDAENEVFYERLKRHDETRDGAMEGYEEHKIITRLLNELDHMVKSDKRWGPKFEVLRENLEHHVEEEESELFDAARRVLDEREAERIGQEFEQVKDELRAVTGRG